MNMTRGNTLKYVLNREESKNFEVEKISLNIHMTFN
jgi:hypothetical protein